MRVISTTKGMSVTVDDDQYDWLNQWKWTHHSRGYAYRVVNKKTVLMHRLITDARSGELVDHIDLDKSNNQRSNLRLCTFSDNMCNRVKPITSTNEYKGISYKRELEKWTARIHKDGKEYHLGVFSTAMDAAIAYDKAAIEMHGSFARTNF